MKVEYVSLILLACTTKHDDSASADDTRHSELIPRPGFDLTWTDRAFYT
jgi:hypothetical protein